MKLTKQQILEIQGTDARYITKDQISWFSPDQIGALSPDQIGWLSPAQIGWLSPDQIGALSPDQIGCLTPAQISWFSPDQIGALSPDQIGWLSPDQIGGLSPDQIGWLSAAQIGALSPDQIGALSPDQIGALSPECRDVLNLKDIPKLEKPYTKILAAVNGGGLEMQRWHTCETTHCIGGWTTTLTPKGKEFEAKFGLPLAAELILKASRPDAPLPNFTASNEAAMAFIEARAAEEN